MPFNALRYLGEALKSVASDRKVNQNKKKWFIFIVIFIYFI